MSAFKFGDPVKFNVDMAADDLSLHVKVITMGDGATARRRIPEMRRELNESLKPFAAGTMPTGSCPRPPTDVQRAALPRSRVAFLPARLSLSPNF
jgi:hypothetical protein